MKKFKKRLSKAKTQGDLATLAGSVLEESRRKNDTTEKMRLLLDAGLSEYGYVDGDLWFWDLLYIETPQNLKVAKVILDRIDILKVKYDDETVFEVLQSKIDYYDFKSDYLVRLFLLFCAYMGEVKGLKMSEDLYPEMFDEEIHFSGAIDIRAGSQPLQLTREIFKDIFRYDWCIEMEEQRNYQHGCWTMHIFDKLSKIEIATYRGR